MRRTLRSTRLLAGGIDLFGRKFAGWKWRCARLECSEPRSWTDSTLRSRNYAEGDSGDAEVWETALPLTFIGRSIRIDGGGPGPLSGVAPGLYSTYLTPTSRRLNSGRSWGPDLHRAGPDGRIPGARADGLRGAHTNVRELIDRQEPLPNSEGDPARPNVLTMVRGDAEIAKGGNYIARPIEPFSVYVQPGATAVDSATYCCAIPASVKRDLDNGVISTRMPVKFTASPSIRRATSIRMRPRLSAKRFAAGVSSALFRPASISDRRASSS